MHRHVIDGIEIELDDDVRLEDIEQGAEPRAEGEVDLDALQAQAEADVDLEDDDAGPADHEDDEALE